MKSDGNVMTVTVDNAISVYHANLANQATYWNFHSAVSLGLLAFLGAAEGLSSYTRLATGIAYVLFCSANCYVIARIQKNLIATAEELQACATGRESSPPDEKEQITGADSFQGFPRTLGTMKAMSLRVVLGFHIMADLGFLGLMWAIASNLPSTA